MSSDPEPPTPTRLVRPRPSLTELLETGDGLAHLLVAVLLLLLALAVLVSSSYGFIQDTLHPSGEASFVQRALGYLSDILFGVIVLELLSTILTYVRARNLEATIKDFLVVGLISSVRKILLVGAQSSITSATGEKLHASEFITEAIGTIITIVGILLLIAGLIWLDKAHRASAELPVERKE